MEIYIKNLFNSILEVKMQANLFDFETKKQKEKSLQDEINTALEETTTYEDNNLAASSEEQKTDSNTSKQIPDDQKKFILGQYFTKKEIVDRVIKLVLEYKNYEKDITILEPSFGSGKFIQGLKDASFLNIKGLELDADLTTNPENFFHFSLNNKYDLIIGNPPFTKYNLSESYYFPSKYLSSEVSPNKYLTNKLQKKEKEKIENIFLLKCLHHLKNDDSTIAFVLPISFFIKNRNMQIKEKILEKFSTIVVYQNDKTWFDYHIPCCFAIFTNNPNYKNKIIIRYENLENKEEILDLNKINEELIPEVIMKKQDLMNFNPDGTILRKYLSGDNIKYNKSFKENNVSGKNILEKTIIPNGQIIRTFKLAVVRVGNSSVGKCGLIDIENDILNDMFYVIDFKEEFQNNKLIKENICSEINKNQSYFQNVTCRVGSKSIKKEDILDFRGNINNGKL